MRHPCFIFNGEVDDYLAQPIRWVLGYETSEIPKNV